MPRRRQRIFSALYAIADVTGRGRRYTGVSSDLPQGGVRPVLDEADRPQPAFGAVERSDPAVLADACLDTFLDPVLGLQPPADAADGSCAETRGGGDRAIRPRR